MDGHRSGSPGDDYVELHCHSAFSFGDGASTPQELAASAAELGHDALALTDHDGVWGAMEFAQSCRAIGVRPIVGCELTLAAPSPFHLTLLVAEPAGWRNLCRLITEAHSDTRPRPESPPTRPLVSPQALEHRAEGLICLSGCARQGPLARELDSARPSREALASARRTGEWLVSAFGVERLRIELQRPLWRRDRARNRALVELVGRLGVAALATGNAHAHSRSRGALQDALVAVGLGSTLDSSEAQRRGNHAACLMDARSASRRFADHPEAVAETARVAERLEFDLTRDLGYTYPGAEDPGADGRLAELCHARLGQRYAGRERLAEAERRLEEELRVIRGLGLSGFFLLHHEILELAREVAAEVRGPESARSLLPPGRGRGSSVSSVVCYLTGLSHVDPIEADLFLGRFLNDELGDLPDIDLDFPRDVRERLIPRIHELYGHERSALVASFPTYRWRSSVRDFGKALGLPTGEIERVARAGDGWRTPEDARAEIALAIGRRRATAPRWRALAWLATEAHGLPRHLSQHPGGMILSTRSLVELCPVQPAAMEGRQVAQWDKDSCADAGFLKIDLLGLGMLSVVERCVEEVARSRGERIDLSQIPLDDASTFAAIQTADTTGVFQIESRAQMQMLPRSRPESLEDLVVQVAIVRPGPIQGGAVHPYLERRRLMRENPDYEVPYEHPSLEAVLSDTLGAIVFQDQVIQVAMELAGLSAGEAEGLRRAMSRKRSEAALAGYRERLVAGAVERGVPRELAERVFEQIRGFSGFGFPKSHAAAFALLAYQSTWLRVHYGPELLCALIDEQPMGFYPADALVNEARRRGIEVRGPDVNASALECRTEPREGSAEPAVRLGLGQVRKAHENELSGLVAERERTGPFVSIGDLASRSGIRNATLELLAGAGALEGMGGSRRDSLWRAGIARGALGHDRGRDAPVQLSLPVEPPHPPDLPAQGEWDSLVSDYRAFGLSLRAHPMAQLRSNLDEGMLRASELQRTPHGAQLTIAGMVIARQQPETARGIVFLLLEDESGVANVIVPPPLYRRRRLIVRTAAFVAIEGRLERRHDVINVLASDVSELTSPDRRHATVTELADRRAELPDPADVGVAMPSRQSFGRRG